MATIANGYQERPNAPQLQPLGAQYSHAGLFRRWPLAQDAHNDRILATLSLGHVEYVPETKRQYGGNREWLE
jgi:hypothetical protein